MRVIVSNLIFETYIYNHLVMRTIKTTQIPTADQEHRSLYYLDGQLDMDQVMEGFAELLYTEYGEKRNPRLEEDWRVLFLAFLKALLNGNGRYFVEARTRGNARMDIVAVYNNETFVIELKVWRGEKYEDEGIQQLVKYVKSQHLRKGYLLCFSDNLVTPKESSVFLRDGVEIHEKIVAYRDTSSNTCE